MTTIATAGILYLVPTPIGNLGDITHRAEQVLAEVDLIAAEDTRHTGQLLQHLGIKNQLLALHDHNERQRAESILDKVAAGARVALVSDAGMPLISDPGYVLVREARARGLCVVALPGACALVTALAASGLATDKFSFEGFLAAKPQQRRKQLSALTKHTHTLIFYESPHRILASLADLAQVFGPTRQLVLARELSKQFETYLTGSIAEVSALVAADSNQQRGEMVLLVAGATPVAAEALPTEALKTLALLQTELPLKKAAALTAQIYGLKKNELYQHAIENQAKA